MLEEDLHYTVALESPERLFVRAGVVGWRGKAVVIVARQDAQVSSLVAALVQKGASYCADTFAVFDAGGRVHPYPAPVHLRAARECPNTGDVKKPYRPAGRRPLPVGLVLETQCVPGARWRARVLTPAQSVLALLPYTVSPRIRPSFTLAVLGRAAAGAQALRVTHGTTEDAAAALIRHLQQDSEHMREEVRDASEKTDTQPAP
jgi:hypothetical protein